MTVVEVIPMEEHEKKDKGNGPDTAFDPSAHKAPEVVAELEGASEDEARRIAAAELADKGRKSVLAAAGLDEHTRLDASGRILLPHEVSPKPAKG